MKKIYITLTLLLCLSILCGCGAKDMTGKPYSEIEAYMAENPDKTVTYTVTLGDGLKVTNSDTAVVLTTDAQADSMMTQAEYLQQVTDIQYEGTTPDMVLALREAFPNATVDFRFDFLGQTITNDTAVLDFTALTAKDLDTAAAYIRLPEAAESVVLSKNGQPSTLTLEQAAQLQAARPEVHLEYTLELFGQMISTDMERVEYFKAPIGDEGLEQFRTLIPMMYNLTYLKLDWCETSDEATAQLRADFAHKCKVVWRVFIGQNNLLTDSLKLWATWSLTNETVQPLIYCTELKYLDMGHNKFTNLDFMVNMTELEMAIVAVGEVNDIAGIANCTKLEFLELFTSDLDDEDMQHLAGLTNMKYLNVSNLPKVTNLSFTDNMTQLRRLWCVMSPIGKAEAERVQSLHPDCEVLVYAYGDPTDHGWRYVQGTNDTVRSPEYELVTKRFGYENWDFSQYPKGYLTEEITYESLGLTPT